VRGRAFSSEPFGGKPRLEWPKGAMTVPHSARRAYWDDVWAAVIEPRSLTIVHSDGEYTVRLELAELAIMGTVEVADHLLWIENDHGTTSIPLAELEAVYEHPPSEVEIHVATTYPLRDPNARVVGRVAWLLADDALVNIERAQIRLDHRQYGLEKGMEVAFVDALGPGRFAALDVPGRPRQVLVEPLAPYTVTAKVVRGRPRDPAAGSTIAVKPIARRDEVTRLLLEIAEHPEQDHDREVLIDLLADLGEPCAAVFAQLRAGEALTPAKRRIALGPLVHFFKPVEFAHGLPRTATLVKQTPDELDVLLSDVRLGMLEAVRLGKGSIATYTQIVGSRTLISLRRADAPSLAVLRALKAGGHTRLTHLYDVRFSDPAAVAILADPAFASVHDFELRIEHRFAASLVQRLVDDDHGVFARAPRHLTFVNAHLASSVFGSYKQLTNATVTVAGVTVARVGGTLVATIARDASPAAVTAMRAMLPEIT
jgi:hypothetical protein